MRARYYLRSVKPEPGEPLDTDLREIVFKKNNYGPISESIMLRWTDGLFLPVSDTTLDQAGKEAVAQEIFVTLLRRFNTAKRNVNDKPGPSYAPAAFAKEDEAKRAGLTSRNLERAMRQLFRDEKIGNEEYSRPSRPYYRLTAK